MKDSLSRINFSFNKFKVVQSLVRNKYQVFNQEDELILKAKQKMFQMKEEFPFTDPEGKVIFRIKAGKKLDLAGDYAIIDEETGEKIGLLSKKFTFFKHVWHIKDPETEEEIAEINSRSAALEFLRSLSDILSFLPHKYVITGTEGDELGTIKGEFSLKDTYNIELEDDIPHKEVIVAASIAIDALEGN